MTTKRTPGARGRAAARELADVPTQLPELAGMTVEELAARYRELYGEPGARPNFTSRLRFGENGTTHS